MKNYLLRMLDITENVEYLIPIESGEAYSIGRSGAQQEEVISVQDRQINLASESISREHAKILLDDGVLKYEDLGSTNGTTYPDKTPVLKNKTIPVAGLSKVVLASQFELSLQIEKSHPPKNPAQPPRLPKKRPPIKILVSESHRRH